MLDGSTAGAPRYYQMEILYMSQMNIWQMYNEAVSFHMANVDTSQSQKAKDASHMYKVWAYFDKKISSLIPASRIVYLADLGQ